MAIKGSWLRGSAAAAAVGGLLVAGHLALGPRPAARTRLVTAPSATPSASPSSAADVLPDPAGSVGTALGAYALAHRAHVGVAVLDRVTGVSVTYNSGVRFATASVVKVDILATVLWRAQRAGREPTAGQRREQRNIEAHGHVINLGRRRIEVGRFFLLARAVRVLEEARSLDAIALDFIAYFFPSQNK